jgi:hypothetical protein
LSGSAQKSLRPIKKARDSLPVQAAQSKEVTQTTIGAELQIGVVDYVIRSKEFDYGHRGRILL